MILTCRTQGKIINTTHSRVDYIHFLDATINDNILSELGEAHYLGFVDHSDIYYDNEKFILYVVIGVLGKNKKNA